MTHELVMRELAHELRSPLCLVVIQAEKYDDGVLMRSGRRIEWLLRFAVAATAGGIAVEAAPIERALGSAVEAIKSYWPGLRAEGIPRPGVLAVLPSDAELAETLLVAWLEAALYGASDTAIAIDFESTGGGLSLTARAVGKGQRASESLSRRLCVLAAANLARLVGGRLILSTSTPRACLLLKRAAQELPQQTCMEAAA